MTTWVGTGWKMNKTLAQAHTYAQTLAATDPERWPGGQPFILPPATRPGRRQRRARAEVAHPGGRAERPLGGRRRVDR